MLPLKRYFITLFVVLLVINLPAQDLTGTWEGDLENDQFLQLNIIQTGDKICGYTRDHVKADQRSYCKAFFEGTFDKQAGKLKINGKFFIENSGSHTLMRLTLAYKKVKGRETLEEGPTLRSIISSMMSGLGRADRVIIEEPDPLAPSVYLRKVSDQPYEIIELMKDCIAQDKKKTDTVVKMAPPPKPKKDSTPAVVTIIPPPIKESVPPVTAPEPVVVKKDSVATPKTFTQRKNKEQSRITVNVKSINLKVYDNAVMDGDTVSILYNGKLLISHQLLSEKGIELNLELDENQSHHEIVLFAENLGSIPPNTALVVITAGDKRYELFASASLEENAVLVFDYKPK